MFFFLTIIHCFFFQLHSYILCLNYRRWIISILKLIELRNVSGIDEVCFQDCFQKGLTEKGNMTLRVSGIIPGCNT